MRGMQSGDPSNGKDSVYTVVGAESKGVLSHMCGMLGTLLLVHRSFSSQWMGCSRKRFE